MPDIYPSLAVQTPNVVGNYLGGIQVGQQMDSNRVRNQLLLDEQEQRRAAVARDEQFRNLLAQSVGPMAAGAAQPPDEPGANYLMQSTQNPLAPGESFNQLLQLDPERALQIQNAMEAQRQQREAQARQRAGVAVRGAQFVLKSKDPKRTLELGFPDMVEQLKQNGIELDDLDDDAVRAMAEDVVSQFAPMAGMGPAGQGEDFTLGEGQVRYRADGTEVARGPAKKEGAEDDKTFSQTNVLRGQYDDAVAGFNTMRSAYENVQNAKPNDAGDTQLVLNYMRVISPGIRVQPGERIDDAASVPGVPATAIQLWNKVVGGGKLNDGQRDEIRQQARVTYQAGKRQAAEARERYTNLARFSQLDPYGVVGDDFKPVAEYNAQGVRVFDTPEEAEAAGLKKGTRIIVNGVPGKWE